MTKMCYVTKTITKDGKEQLVCDDTRARLMEFLHNEQEEKGYISDEAMQSMADCLGIHPVEVYSVVTFYSFLTTKPRGQNIIRVSTCMPCVMAGADKIVEAFEQRLGIAAGETTQDQKFSLERTSCIGMCDQAPAILVNDRLLGKVTPEMVEDILKDLS